MLSPEVMDVLGGMMRSYPDADAVMDALEADPSRLLYNVVSDFTDPLHVLGRLAHAASFSPDDDLFDFTAQQVLAELVSKWDMVAPALLNVLVDLPSAATAAGHTDITRGITAPEDEEHEP